MKSEAHRVLKALGLFISTTPNLASWVNRLLLFLGYLLVHTGCSLKYDLKKTLAIGIRPMQPRENPHVQDTEKAP